MPCKWLDGDYRYRYFIKAAGYYNPSVCKKGDAWTKAALIIKLDLSKYLDTSNIVGNFKYLYKSRNNYMLGFIPTRN